MARLTQHRGETVLLYSADMEGHREVYCRIIADFLLARGCAVVIAGNLRVDSGSLYAMLEPLAADPRVRMIDTTPNPPRRVSLDLAALSRLMRACGATSIILAEADACLGLLTDQLRVGRRRLPGRRVGIFLRSGNYIHSGATPRSLRHTLSRARALRTSWQHDGRLFHEWLLPHCRLLDAALSLDEVFVAARSGAYAWLPDIFRADEEPLGMDPERTWLVRLEEFTRAHAGRPILVYYGTARKRRGYDTVVRLADAEGACFVHCGRRDVPDAEEAAVRSARRRLQRSGRLFETETTIKRFDVGERFLAAGDCVVLPYRGHFGSSGVMLQALQASRPVLVPDIGLMADRAMRHGVGLTYRHDDFEDLRREYARLRDQGPEPYRPRISRFLRYFDRSQVDMTLSWSLGWRASPATNPVEATTDLTVAAGGTRGG